MLKRHRVCSDCCCLSSLPASPPSLSQSLPSSSKHQETGLGKSSAINFIISGILSVCSLRRFRGCWCCCRQRSNGRRGILINEILYAKMFHSFHSSCAFLLSLFTITSKKKFAHVMLAVVAFNLLFANESRELSVHSLDREKANSFYSNDFSQHINKI